MLKEGWDVRNVYVIASMRSSVSEILTEQTLGRGMRLAFGRYTEVEILDTLEVIAHERYQDLLRKAGVLNQAFIDHRTRAALRVNAQGQQVVVKETTPASSAAPVIAGDDNTPPPAPEDDLPKPVVTTTDQRAAQAGAAVRSLRQEVSRQPGAPVIRIPALRMTNVKSHFSLADIPDPDAFRRLGVTLAADPDNELSRTVVSARVIRNADGVKRTELVTSPAADRVRSAPRLFPEQDLRRDLADAVLASSAVPARKSERAALAPLLDAFFNGLGANAVEVLSANLDRAAARLIRLVEQEQRKYMAKPVYEEVTELHDFNPARATDKDISADRFGAFSKSVAYEGWQRNMYALAWFDSRTERDVANLLDDDVRITAWARLHIGDIPILWNGAGQNYNPDLLAVEDDGTHWLIEVKMDKEMPTAEVQDKRIAATRWANHVSADESVGVTWRYLLASETDTATAKGSWTALKQLTR